MKTLFTIIASLFYYTLSAQTINFTIDGNIENPLHAKYAYLSTLSQQIPISSDKIFIAVPVVNGKFEFKGSFNLEGKMMQQACIFFDDRANISKDELALKFKNLIWVTGREPHLLRIILENLSLQVKGRDENSIANVTNNGIYTKQYYEYILANKKGRKELVDFIKKYKNSPISLIALQSVYFREEEQNSRETVSSLFNELTLPIKTSKEGQAMKKSLSIK
jgi:hypothetical protein